MSAEGQEPPDPQPWTGPWADDARRLFQLLQTMADQAGASADGESSESSGSAEYQHPPECRYCPFCQGISLLRRAGPDVLDQLSDFAAGLAATLRATQPPPDGPSAEGSDDPSARSSGDPSTGPVDDLAGGGSNAPARPPSTVRIDVTD